MVLVHCERAYKIRKKVKPKVNFQQLNCEVVIPRFVYEMNKFFQLKFLQVYTPPMYNLACLGKFYILDLFWLS